MQYRKLILAVFALLFSQFGVLAHADEKPGVTQSPLSYELVVDKKVGPRTDAVTCCLRIRNDTDVLQHTFRPQEKDIALAIKRVEAYYYSVVFTEHGFESLNKTGIYLRPHCAIEVKLARIVLRERGKIRPPLPPSYYAVAATWKEAGLPKIKSTAFEIVDHDVPPAPQVQASGNEYPFDVVLEPALAVYYRDEPVTVTVRLENHGDEAVVFPNYFSPYRDFFDFERRYTNSKEKIRDPLRGRMHVDPLAYKGSMVLLPRERLLVDIDIGDEFPIPAEYSVSTVFPCSLTLWPPEGSPHHTKQLAWRSNEVVMTISDAPRPNDPPPTQGQK